MSDKLQQAEKFYDEGFSGAARTLYMEIIQEQCAQLLHANADLSQLKAALSASAIDAGIRLQRQEVESMREHMHHQGLSFTADSEMGNQINIAEQHISQLQTLRGLIK